MCILVLTHNNVKETNTNTHTHVPNNSHFNELSMFCSTAVCLHLVRFCERIEIVISKNLKQNT